MVAIEDERWNQRLEEVRQRRGVAKKLQDERQHVGKRTGDAGNRGHAGQSAHPPSLSLPSLLPEANELLMAV